MTSPEAVYHETITNFEVNLLLMFMVAGIYFTRGLEFHGNFLAHGTDHDACSGSRHDNDFNRLLIRRRIFRLAP